MPRGRSSKLVLVTFALLASAFVIAIGPHGLFSGDSGVKFAQSVDLWEQGYGDRSLIYDYDVDPNARHFPYQKPDFIRKVGDGHQGTYSVVYTALCAALMAALGDHGGLALSLLGLLACLLALHRVARYLELPPAFEAVGHAALLATPLLFYSAQLAEHSVAAGLLALATSFLALPKERPWLAGSLAAMAAVLRPEMYCAVAALGIATVLIPKRTIRERALDALGFLGAALAILGAYWLLNIYGADTWDPLVGANTGKVHSWYFANVFLWGKVRESSSLVLWMGSLCAMAAAGSAAACLAPRVRPHLVAPVALLLVILAGLAYAQSSARVVAGLFAVTPVLGLGLLLGPRHRLAAFFVVPVLFIAQVVLMPSGGNGGGLQFGSRLLLPALPALLVAALVVVHEAWQALRGGYRGLLVLLCLALLATGVRSTAVGHRSGAAIVAHGNELVTNLRALEAKRIVTRRGWESQLAAPLRRNGAIIHDVQGSLVPLLSKLALGGISEIAVVSKLPINLELRHGYVARTVQTRKGWLHVQKVELSRTMGR